MSGDELRARRLAKLIASIAVLDERIHRILEFGNARYQEGYEAGKKEGEPTEEDWDIDERGDKRG